MKIILSMKHPNGQLQNQNTSLPTPKAMATSGGHLPGTEHLGHDTPCHFLASGPWESHLTSLTMFLPEMLTKPHLRCCKDKKTSCVWMEGGVGHYLERRQVRLHCPSPLVLPTYLASSVIPLPFSCPLLHSALQSDPTSFTLLYALTSPHQTCGRCPYPIFSDEKTDALRH